MPRVAKKEKIEEVENKIEEIIKPKITRKKKETPPIIQETPPIIQETPPIIQEIIPEKTQPINIIKPKKKVIFC